MALKNAFRGALFVTLPTAGKVQFPQGVNDLGNAWEWDAFTGGKYSVKESKYIPFDGVERTHTGNRETENLTIEADYVESVHGPLLAMVDGELPEAEDLRGKRAEFIVKDRDENGNFQQNRNPYVGKILEIVPPDGDSNDGGTIAKIQIILSIGRPAV